MSISKKKLRDIKIRGEFRVKGSDVCLSETFSSEDWNYQTTLWRILEKKRGGLITRTMKRSSGGFLLKPNWRGGFDEREGKG